VKGICDIHQFLTKQFKIIAFLKNSSIPYKYPGIRDGNSSFFFKFSSYE
jgi:hypothetical protein